MTSVPKPQTSLPRRLLPHERGSSAQQLCLIVGMTCLVGFAINVVVIGLPPNPFALEWRVNFLQQVGDRSIILLFGSALVLYSQLGNRRVTRPLSLICLGIGVALMLSCILVIRDNLLLKEQAVNNIAAQAEQLQVQLDEGRVSPELPENVTPEQFEQVEQQLVRQAEQLKQTTQTDITKAGLASIGNLIVVGLGLVGLGRFGLVRARRVSGG